MLTPLQHNNNVTVHYLRNDKEEITVAKEHNPILYGKTLKRAPPMGNGIQEGGGSDSNTIPITYYDTNSTTCQDIL